MSTIDASSINNTDITDILYDHILKRNWSLALDRCQTHPRDAKHVNERTGSTPLSVACSMGSVPDELVHDIVSAYPKAVIMQDYYNENTPLHWQANNCQKSLYKISLLVHTFQQQRNKNLQTQNGKTPVNFQQKLDKTLRNKYGKTPLHIACSCNAILPVFHILVTAYPGLLKIRDYNGRTPLTILWNSYISTIPGHLAIASFLQNENSDNYQDTNNHFDRFYEKVRYLMADTHIDTEIDHRFGNDNHKHMHTDSQQLFHDSSNREQKYLGHAILFKNSGPFDLFKLAVKREPILARVADSNGNNLLHILVMRRPFWKKDFDAISFLLDAFPGAATKYNHFGLTPLYLAIESNLSWTEGLKELMYAAPSVLERRDPRTNLFPFMLAASMNKKISLDSTFELLCANPDIVKIAL